MGAWDAWIGRSETWADRIDESRVAQWLATFDRAAPADGTVPQGFHWCLCTPDAPTAELGPDGHPRRNGVDGFLPPIPLPRRMWASSEIEFHRPLRLDDRVVRVSVIHSVEIKSGASGQLAFVELQHDTSVDSILAVRERQTLVYRELVAAAAPARPAAPDPQQPVQARRTLCPSATLLFRYSALTFNSHRIHYDLPYATGSEGYSGLVVHGPLTATLMLDLARRQLGDNRLARFSFRGIAPAFAGQELTLSMDHDGPELAFTAKNAAGGLIMQARGALIG